MLYYLENLDVNKNRDVILLEEQDASFVIFKMCLLLYLKEEYHKYVSKESLTLVRKGIISKDPTKISEVYKIFIKENEKRKFEEFAYKEGGKD